MRVRSLKSASGRTHLSQKSNSQRIDRYRSVHLTRLTAPGVLRRILGVLGYLGPPFGALGLALGVHFGGQGVLLGAFDAQSVPRTALLF